MGNYLPIRHAIGYIARPAPIRGILAGQRVEQLALWQYALIGLLFVWGGFVRSGLGFGGAVLTLPFLLFILDEPLVFLPIIAVHLMLFSSLTIITNQRKENTVNWVFLRRALLIMALPKLAGVLGVITLPGNLISGFIFIVVSIYAMTYILDRPFNSNNRWVDGAFLVIGGYVSGASLIAAPLVVPVAASQVRKEQLRDTLFALWFILVGIKIAAFLLASVDMQWQHHLWLLPCATIGHFAGLRFHRYTLRSDTRVFFRYMGFALLAVSLAGMWRLVSHF